MRVPVYERKLGISPLPGVQVSPAYSPSDNGQNTGRIIQGLAARLQKINDDTEDARTLELFNKFKQESQEYHENPDNGIYNIRLGYNSRGIYREADEWLRRKGEDYARDLDPRAKFNFRKMAEEYIQQRGAQNSRFEAAQMKQYQAEQAEATIKNSLNYAEQNWENPDAIAQARKDAQQAIELRTRGAGKEAFDNAYGEFENQLAVARIRQAYVKDPLLAVRMLDDPDIQLNPKTEAQLRESLSNKTEVYELQAIAQAYAKYYTPENQNDAYNALIQRYGADKGQKAFAALSHIWGVKNAQDNAQKSKEAEERRNYEDNLTLQFLDKNAPRPTKQQILSDRQLSPNAKARFISVLDAEEKDAARLQNEQHKLQRKKNEWILRINAWEHKYPSDEMLKILVERGDLDENYAEQNRIERIRHEEQLKKDKDNSIKKKQQDTASKFTAMIVDPENNGHLSIEAVKSAMNSSEIEPRAAQGIIEYLESLNAQDKKTARAKFENALTIIAENGGIISRNSINNLLSNERISPSHAKYLYGKIEQYNQEQAVSLKEQAKAQAEDDERKHQEDLSSMAAQISRAYPTGKKGDGEKYIRELNIPLKDKEALLKYYNGFISTQEQQLKDSSNALKEAHDKLYLNIWYAAMNGQHLPPETLNKMRADKDITPEQFNELTHIRTQQETAQKKADEELRNHQLLEAGDNLANELGLGQQKAAYDRIREEYTDPEEANKVIAQYNRRIQEQSTARNEQEKALREQQKQNYTGLMNDYWRLGKTVPLNTLRELEHSKGLSEEQILQAENMNRALNTRSGIEKNLADNYPGFADLSRNEQEKLIMQYMGTNENKRRENLAMLLKRATEGTATDEMYEWYYAHGYISTDDKARLKDYESKFEREQKLIVSDTAKRLQEELKSLNIPGKDKNLYIDHAVNDFFRNVQWLDPHANNFKEAVQEAFNAAFAGAAATLEGRYSTDSSFLFIPTGRTPFGKRIDAAQSRVDNFTTPQNNPQIQFENASGDIQLINPQGDTQTFNNTINIPQPPAPEPAPAYDPRNNATANNPYMQRISNPRNYTKPRDLGLEMVEGGTVTGKFTDKRAYRNGTHNGQDVAAKEGTPIIAKDFGLPLTVSKINTKTPTKGGGNSVTLAGYSENGDYYEFIISHMKNGSIPLSVGDLVLPGTVIGQVGNTGMTSDRQKGGVTAWYEGKSSGYHMDLKIKKNGKYIDPQKYKTPASSQQYIGPTIENARNLPQQPQPDIQPPVISSNDEQNALLMYTLFGDFASQDIFSPMYDFGVGF